MNEKVKNLDCVRMKDEIQAKLLKEYRGLTDAEIARRVRRKLETSDSPVARLWRAVRARESATDQAPQAPSATPRRRRRKLA